MADNSYSRFDAGQDAPPSNGSTLTGEQRIAPVPENVFQVTDPLLLQMTEDVVGSARIWEVIARKVGLEGKFDTAHLRDIHAHVMQDIYAEPGATRGDERLLAQQDFQRASTPIPLEYDTRIGSRDEEITLLSARKVNGRLDMLSDLLERENTLRGLDKPAFIDKLTDYYTQYSHAAPFAAGNEHVLAVVIYQIGFEAGYEVHPGAAPMLREAIEGRLEAGVTSDKSRLYDSLNAATTEGRSIEAQARRNPTQSAIRLVLSEEIKKYQAEEDIAQAGSILAGRVGGAEGVRFRASMRAIIEGNAIPEHLNVVRTTALNYAGDDLSRDTKRIEQNTAFLDNYRREEQQRGRQADQANVTPRQPERTTPGEISR